MTETTDIAVMIDRGGSVDNRVRTDLGAGLNYNASMNLRSWVNHGPR